MHSLPSTDQPTQSKPPTSLDALETTSPPVLFPLRWPFQHTGWRERREMTYDALASAGCSRARLERFAMCRSVYHVQRNKHDRTAYRVIAGQCRDRFCTPCARHRSAWITLQLRNLIPDDNVRLISLTLGGDLQDLTRALDHLYASYRRLRRTRFWRAACTAAAAVCEVTYNPLLHRWHPHLHVLAHGRYIRQAILADEWQLATHGTSRIVDIRLVRGRERAIHYVTKYVNKPLAAIYSDPNVLQQAVSALTGRKLISTSGAWAKANLSGTPSDPDWEYVGSIGELLIRQFESDDYADMILSAIPVDVDRHIGETFYVSETERSPPGNRVIQGVLELDTPVYKSQWP